MQDLSICSSGCFEITNEVGLKILCVQGSMDFADLGPACCEGLLTKPLKDTGVDSSTELLFMLKAIASRLEAIAIRLAPLLVGSFCY